MKSLLNCYLPVFKTGVSFKLAPEKHPEFTLFQQQIMTDISRSMAAAEQYFAQGDCRSACFAVVVWFDELVLQSSPEWIDSWRRDLLQTRLFDTAIGGSEFFSRLEKINKKNWPLRQVYLFCLLLGFKGIYAWQDKNLLQQRIAAERDCFPEEWQDAGATRLINVTASEGESRLTRYAFFLNKPVLAGSVIFIYLIMVMSGLYLLKGV